MENAVQVAPRPSTGAGNPISMIRSTPPAASGVAEAARATLQEIAEGADYFDLIMHHRFGGTDEDRQAALKWFSARSGARLDPDQLLVVNSAQNAMTLVLGELFKPGDTLLVENLSYHGLRKIARLLAINVVPIAMDADGAEPGAFEEACKRYGAKGLYLMPTLHNPTSIIMSLERRLELARIARKYGAAIIEDDVYAPLPVSAPPPFMALASDITWYLTSFAKCIGPGLRVGYIVGPDREAIANLRERINGVSTWFPAPLSAEFVKRWLNDGTMERLAMSVRAEAQERQRIATKLLALHSFVTQPESLFLWLDLPQSWSQDAFVDAAAENGVTIRPGYTFADNPRDAPHSIRIVLGSPETRDDLRKALTVLDDLLVNPPRQNSLVHG